MKSKDTEIFEEAFNELDKEGYFKDFAVKVKNLPSTSKANTKAYYDARTPKKKVLNRKSKTAKTVKK